MGERFSPWLIRAKEKKKVSPMAVGTWRRQKWQGVKKRKGKKKRRINEKGKRGKGKRK